MIINKSLLIPGVTRVVLLVNNPDMNRDLVAGSCGTFMGHFDAGDRPGIRWDNKIRNGHACNNTCEVGYGWYVDLKFLDIIQEDDADDCDQGCSDSDISALIFG